VLLPPTIVHTALNLKVLCSILNIKDTFLYFKNKLDRLIRGDQETRVGCFEPTSPNNQSNSV